MVSCSKPSKSVRELQGDPVTDDAFEAGLAQRHAMFGTAGGQEQLDAATDFTRPLQEWVTKQCFGESWQRPVLDARMRTTLTLAMLVACLILVVWDLTLVDVLAHRPWWTCWQCWSHGVEVVGFWRAWSTTL